MDMHDALASMLPGCLAPLNPLPKDLRSRQSPSLSTTHALLAGG